MSQRQRRRKDQRRRQTERRGPSKRQVAAGATIALGATLAATGSAQAADFTVTNLNDSGPGSLRQAIEDADTNPGPDRVLFQSGLSGTITLTGGQLVVFDPVQISGPGAGQLAVSGNGSSRVIGTDHAGAVSISGLTLRDGSINGSGGGIYSKYTDLTLTDTVVSGNSSTEASGQGGGVAVYHGTLTADRSTISGNTVPNGNGFGGGIWTDAAPAVIRNSTISGNTSNDDGGGFYVSQVPVPTLIQNSTISGNTATVDDGGGIYIGDGPHTDPANRLVIRDSTVAGNSAGSNGGGIQTYYTFSPGAYTLLEDTIFSGNSAVEGTPDIYGTVDAAFSLVQNPFVGTGYKINQTGPDLLGVDPQLGPLASNGGPTQTEAPSASSPVVDKGNAFGLNTDQRGVLRPIDFPAIPNAGDGSDIGAVEVQPSSSFKLGKLKRNKKKGTAEQVVILSLPDAGSVTINGKGLKTKTRSVTGAANVKLPVIAKGKKRKALGRSGKAKIKAQITYSPIGNAVTTLKKKLKLLKR
jgi:hypothetical protein